MASEESLRLARLIVGLLSHSRKEHGHGIVCHKTKRGSMERLTNLAIHGWEKWLNALAGQLSDQALLLQLGISAPDAVGRDEMHIEVETMLAHYAWQMQLQLLGVHLEHMLHYSWSFPCVAYGLIHKDEAKAKASLSHVKLLWEVWQDAEKAAHTDANVASIVWQIVWMSWQWPRLLCLELAEFDFQSLPSPLYEELVSTCMGPYNTTKTKQKNKQQPRMHSWDYDDMQTQRAKRISHAS